MDCSNFSSKDTAVYIREKPIHSLVENICKDISDTGLVSSIYEELLQLNNKQTTQLK